MPPDFHSPNIPSPCFIVDAEGLRRNGTLLKHIQDESGARIILALKSFAMHPSFPVLKPYLAGTTASSLNEVLLAHHEFGKEIHGYAVAYSEKDLDQLLTMCTHLTFNSLTQWDRFREKAHNTPDVSFGLRINPRYSEVSFDLYNPCIAGSRLGITVEELDQADLTGIRGLHFHTLCEQGSEALERTLVHVEEQFGDYLHRMDWLNLGGGHLITKPGYDVERLIGLLKRLKATYDLDIIMEPGEAVARNAGWLVTEVQDVFTSQGVQHGILDTSASAHMPDVLEMPYRPSILNSGLENEKAHNYKLGGVTCLAGDRLGTFSFDQPLKVGDRLVFTNMAIYTMVKTTQFNGIRHPAIALWDPENEGLTITRTFNYDDFKHRLG